MRRRQFLVASAALCGGLLVSSVKPPVAMATSNGKSIHIGIKNVDPSAYGGWDGRLKGCENDALAMKALADSQGFKSSVILTQSATAQNVLAAIGATAADLQNGDMLLLTYSGHGGRLPDPDDGSKYVSTWGLWDRQLIGHELYRMWSNFRPGVRILVVSDSCHSGTVVRVLSDGTVLKIDRANVMDAYLANTTQPAALAAAGVDRQTELRSIPTDISVNTYASNRPLYDGLIRASNAPYPTVNASILLISACQDDETTPDGAQNGLFTAALLIVWDKGRFNGTYLQFRDGIKQLVQNQTPNYFSLGAPGETYWMRKPFAI
jgi:hypothetical protein